MFINGIVGEYVINKQLTDIGLNTLILNQWFLFHYDGRALRCNPGLQYPPWHGPVHTPDNNRWHTPPV